MTKNCPLCATELPDSHPAFRITAFLAWVDGDWSQFEDHGKSVYSHTHPLGKEYDVPGVDAPVHLIARKSNYDLGELATDSYYFSDGLPQGTTYKTYLVFQIGDLFFKKVGTGDSYGDVNWDGEFLPTRKISKTVEVFE